MGHDIKGVGAAYGFPALSRLGAELEEAARAGTDEAVQRIADELVWYVDHVRVIYPNVGDAGGRSRGSVTLGAVPRVEGARAVQSMTTVAPQPTTMLMRAPAPAAVTIPQVLSQRKTVGGAVELS